MKWFINKEIKNVLETHYKQTGNLKKRIKYLQDENTKLKGQINDYNIR